MSREERVFGSKKKKKKNKLLLQVCLRQRHKSHRSGRAGLSPSDRRIAFLQLVWRIALSTNSPHVQLPLCSDPVHVSPATRPRRLFSVCGTLPCPTVQPCPPFSDQPIWHACVVSLEPWFNLLLTPAYGNRIHEWSSRKLASWVSQRLWVTEISQLLMLRKFNFLTIFTAYCCIFCHVCACSYVDPYVIPEKENRPSLFSDYKKWVKYAKLRMRNTGMTAARLVILHGRRNLGVHLRPPFLDDSLLIR